MDHRWRGIARIGAGHAIEHRVETSHQRGCENLRCHLFPANPLPEIVAIDLTHSVAKG